MDVVCETVAELSKAVQAYVRGDLSAKTIAIDSVAECEHKADLLKKKILGRLTEGLLLPADHEDLLHMVKHMDKVADWTNSAARLLAFLDDRLPEAVFKNMAIGTELIVDSATELRKAICALAAREFQVATAACEEADRLEHKADEQKRAMIEAVIRAKMDATNLLLCYNLAESLEGVTDRVGSCADAIKIIMIKLK